MFILFLLLLAILFHRDDLERQVEVIRRYAEERGWDVEILRDIDSGLSEKRKDFQKLLRMVMDRQVSKVCSLSIQINEIWVQNPGGIL